MLRAMRRIFVLVILLLCALFLYATAASAQTAVNYRFLEVIDTAGKPVADAEVETLGSGRSSHRTDEQGTVSKLPFYYGDFTTTGFKVSKPGYLTYTGGTSFDYNRYWKLLDGEIPQYDPKKIKVVLLKTPLTESERAAFEAERKRQELLLAVREGHDTTVQLLLQNGADPNATDAYGIPAILWAVATGDKRKIEALLKARADVRRKNGPGRKALLYYLYNVRYEFDYEIIRTLIERGADVNAADKEGISVLALARRQGDAKIIKLLESAGAR